MISVVAVIEASDGLAIGGDRGDDAWRTLDYLPGRQLRGAVAAAHRLLRPSAIAEFNRWLSVLTVADAYPIDDALAADEVPSVRVLPRTAMSCKDFPGFSRDGSGHPVRDELIPAVLFVLDGQQRSALFPGGGVCSRCDAPLERLSGYLVEHGGRQWRVTPRRELRAHVGISRARGGAVPGILFSRQHLVAGTRFLAGFRLPEELLAPVREFLDDAAEAGVLRVGSGRSRGLGAIRVVSGWHPAPALPPLADRLARFNAALRASASHHQVALPGACYLPITLRSDAIVLDEAWRPCGQLTASWLREATGIEGRLVFVSAGVRATTGWNDFAGLPREVAPAIERGSVFVFELATPPSDQVLTRLEALEATGIGEECQVGFGAIRFADPVHIEVHPEASP